MKYDFDNVVSRKGTNAIKYDKELINSCFNVDCNEETIFSWVADMDFQCSNPIIKAIKERADKQIFGYSNYLSDSEYYLAITNWFKKRYDWDIDKNHIVHSIGTVSGLETCINTLTDESDGIIIQRPVYNPFALAVESNNRNLINNELVNNDGYYSMNYEDLERKAKNPKNKMMILCNPHNPVGRVWKDEELLKLANICLDNNLIIITDEIHGDLTRSEHKFTPLKKLVNSDNVIVCTAINKTFNTAGLKCANLIISSNDYREKYNKEVGIQKVSPFVPSVLKAAYNESGDWLDQVNEYLDENFIFTENFFKEKMPRVKFLASEGTYLAWIDFRNYNLSSEDIYRIILKEANIFAKNGNGFGKEGDGFIRINLACPKCILEEILNRIENAFKLY
jgi:cystathionine beta-lyase